MPTYSSRRSILVALYWPIIHHQEQEEEHGVYVGASRHEARDGCDSRFGSQSKLYHNGNNCMPSSTNEKLHAIFNVS